MLGACFGHSSDWTRALNRQRLEFSCARIVRDWIHWSSRVRKPFVCWLVRNVGANPSPLLRMTARGYFSLALVSLAVFS